MIVLKAVHGMKEHFHHRVIEWVALWPMLGMAFVLTIQPNMFSLAQHYKTLALWAPEENWRNFLLLAAGFRLIALSLNSTSTRFKYCVHFRLAASMIGFLIWFRFSAGFIYGGLMNGSSLGPVVSYGTIALIEAINLFQASRELGRSAKGPR